ncbi:MULTISPECIES: CDP-diacylglycerol--serine O-phosphatidyltransferase [Clostridium]|jgi:CDP-diacylglycerol--serine O-phosphatidyltransferase|uniref:CDP-diacylglycerol--serine O-phosphatidyltransferase n=1 Tax=Clostridium saccharoperbutylacetonicum N1-4(HMT) TaxID=931276 RepID=M1N653_9CLOT|nr:MULTISPECIES: CDP-diacylglycerol--serine O-phosphatidyltransferase [Clostridium]AGF58887.1 CDP-diacylglycerol--serine O-phosphatidyltransferase [Clostridium saccharoperbutylacetonicum N1-4(HMT)]AQR97566.1 CDP-alcohol phosphatidyltransferase [Clostridium saccharoperbutylacetonicum]NRT60328.1 CDP-diacylglycerol--serine O-phosphatidyltransferase [Clostridium saccharoperbutylacetonicum]NSB23640.1 CDP-diacylglycerol--serine O-phosphatidyltransferase [Clostridium saccharoperbutylacetonicum]NSB334
MRKSCIPNVFTFINLSCGIISILSAMNDNYPLAGAFILLAGLVDRYDGRIARFLDVSSDLGKELDSLADLVSFGVAPSILVYILFNLNTFGPNGLLGYIVLLLFPICGAYRLARFNTTDFDGSFTGVPITIVGCFMALFSLLNLNTKAPVYLVVILMLIGSYLMVSKLKLKKF